MGLRISMFPSNLKENSRGKNTDSSTWCPRSDQPIFLPNIQELNMRQMSRPKSTKTETF
nr:AC4 [Tomato leaf curl Palampur virus]